MDPILNLPQPIMGTNLCFPINESPIIMNCGQPLPPHRLIRSLCNGRLYPALVHINGSSTLTVLKVSSLEEYKHHNMAYEQCPSMVVRPLKLYHARREHSSDYDLLLETEFCEGGTLWSFLQENILKLDIMDWVAIMSEFLFFLYQMNQKYPGWRHLDTHPSNIFICHVPVEELSKCKIIHETKTVMRIPFIWKKFHLKIGDFGQSEYTSSKELSHPARGSGVFCYDDIHLFCNQLLQNISRLHRRASPGIEYKTPQEKSMHHVQSLSQPLPLHMDNVIKFLQYIVPPELRYSNSHFETPSHVGVSITPGGVLKKDDASMVFSISRSPATLLSTHPFFDCLRVSRTV